MTKQVELEGDEMKSTAVIPITSGQLETVEDLAQSIGFNLRRLTTKKGLSLERLAKLSGVSRAMLGQIELGKSVPTISLLWKVAHALAVPFSALNAESIPSNTVVLRANKSKVLTSIDGRFKSRALFPYEGERTVEFYEIEIAPGTQEVAEAHAINTIENLVIIKGEVEITVGDEIHILKERDSIFFQADVPHSYKNTGSENAIIYMVMIYAEKVS